MIINHGIFSGTAAQQSLAILISSGSRCFKSIRHKTVASPSWLGQKMGLSENSVPHFPNGFADHYPY